MNKLIGISASFGAAILSSLIFGVIFLITIQTEARRITEIPMEIPL